MTSNLTRTVVGVFDDRTTAQSVVDELASNGFDRGHIEITSHDSYASDAARGNTGLSGSTHDNSGGGIGGFFRRMFGGDSDNDSHLYSEAVNRGSTVVCVTTDETNADRAVDLMERHGAIDIDERSKSWSDYTGAGTGTASSLTSGDVSQGRQSYTDNSTSQSIPVVQEELQIGKRTVQRGGIRVFNRVVERPVEESVTLREEHVRVERRATDRPATEADLRSGEVIEVTEMAEEPVVGKRSRVVEEVVVGKESTERQETVRDTVRHTEVDIQNTAGATTDYSDDFRRDFQTRYGTSGGSYDTYAPSYQYGYQMASDQRYQGRRWEDVESDLRTDYSRRYPGSTWDQMKDSVRFGWNKVTGRS